MLSLLFFTACAHARVLALSGCSVPLFSKLQLDARGVTCELIIDTNQMAHADVLSVWLRNDDGTQEGRPVSTTIENHRTDDMLVQPRNGTRRAWIRFVYDQCVLTGPSVVLRAQLNDASYSAVFIQPRECARAARLEQKRNVDQMDADGRMTHLLNMNSDDHDSGTWLVVILIVWVVLLCIACIYIQ